MCQSCEVLRINGVLCHEQGCPDAWMDEIRQCYECGCDFTPESRNQILCGNGVMCGGDIDWDDDEQDDEYAN
jgi:hypothetical protein